MYTYDKATKATNFTISKAHRVFYFLIGMALMVTMLVNPPVKTEWIAIASLLTIALVMFAIIGQKLQISISMGNRVLNTRLVHALLSISVGIGIIILALVDPPESTVWMAYFNLLGIMIIMNAIIGMDYMFKREGRRFLFREGKTSPIRYATLAGTRTGGAQRI